MNRTDKDQIVILEHVPELTPEIEHELDRSRKEFAEFIYQKATEHGEEVHLPFTDEYLLSQVGRFSIIGCNKGSDKETRERYKKIELI